MISVQNNPNDPSQLLLGQQGAGSITFNPVGAETVPYNAIGLNPEDQYVYGISNPSDAAGPQLVRVDSTGGVTTIGPVTGLPDTGYNVGTFDENGNYYVSGTNSSQIYVIDVATSTVTQTINLSQPLSVSVADLTFSDGYMWGVSQDGVITRVDPTTGTVTQFPSVDILPAQGYGANFTYGDGTIGMIGQQDNLLYRMRITNPGSPVPTFEIISTQDVPSAPYPGIDGAACFFSEADLQLTKTAVPASYVVGDQITYTLAVRNNGPDASSGFSVSDAFRAGLSNITTATAGCTVTGRDLTCTSGALAVGATRNITVTGTVAAGTTGTLVSNACVIGNDEDPVPNNNCDDVPIPPATPDLSIEKTGPSSYVPGGPITFSFVIRNTGRVNAATYTVTDTIPAGVTITNPPAGCTVSGQTLTCTGTNLAAGATRTITVSGTVAQNATGTLTNSVCVETPNDNNDPNNCDDFPVPPTPAAPDPAMEKTGSSTYTPGGPITFSFVVRNVGNANAPTYTVTDTLPAGVTVTNPPAGCTISGQMPGEFVNSNALCPVGSQVLGGGYTIAAGNLYDVAFDYNRPITVGNQQGWQVAIRNDAAGGASSIEAYARRSP
ncbi:DUF11 domain-containing protein [Streptomyces sp. NPDC047023]|uniref:DUF11 domain-containing protein n=1 Tax=Streptomyces sp. NPDC047023 TaxID=3155139 RepID=UPI0033F6C361